MPAGTVHPNFVVGVSGSRPTPVQEVVPTLTVAPVRKFVPSMVTGCEPSFVMLAGLMLVTVATGFVTANVTAVLVVNCESGLVTFTV